MKRPHPESSRLFRGLANWAFFLLILLPAGCGKPPTLVQKYVLEYPPPVPRASAPLEEGIKVEQFSVAQAFNSTAMVYRPTPYKSEAYTYHRWRVSPGYLVTDYLLRDLRKSGLFRVVLSSGSADKARFVLEGGVEEIQEIDEPEGWKAALALNVTLLDTREKEITKRVLFQKAYRVEEPLPEKTPGGLAQGVSRAMARVSGEIIADLYQAAATRSRVPGAGEQK